MSNPKHRRRRFAALAAGAMTIAGLGVVGCGGDSTAAVTVTAPAETVTVDSADTTDYSSDTTDYTDTTDYSSDSSDPYAAASSTYSDYIDRFNSDSMTMQVSQSLVMAAKQIPMGDGSVYCRIGMSTQYAGAVIIDLYLPIGSGMAFMVPSSGSPVIQGEINTAPSQGDPCTVSSNGHVSF